MRSIVCLFLLLGSLTAVAQEAFVRPTTPKEQLAVIKNIQDKALDAESVKVRDLQVAPDGNGNFLVCGEVNGKNTFGGFTGFLPFFGIIYPASDENETRASVIRIGSTEIKQKVVQQMCSDAGIII